jgi:hypothetical protein
MFLGDRIDVVEWERRRKMGLGGYGIEICKDVILDCRRRFEEGECFASAANSYKGVYNIHTGCASKPNVKMIIIRGIVFLKSLDKDIPENSEILYDYGKKYSNMHMLNVHS